MVLFLVQDDLVAEEISVDPMRVAAALLEIQYCPVEFPAELQVPNRDRQMEGCRLFHVKNRLQVADASFSGMVRKVS